MGGEILDLSPDIKTVGDLITFQRSRGEVFDEIFQHETIVRIAVDQEHVDDMGFDLSEAKEIAFFPPMTGG